MSGNILVLKTNMFKNVISQQHLPYHILSVYLIISTHSIYTAVELRTFEEIN